MYAEPYISEEARRFKYNAYTPALNSTRKLSTRVTSRGHTYHALV